MSEREESQDREMASEQGLSPSTSEENQSLLEEVAAEEERIAQYAIDDDDDNNNDQDPTEQVQEQEVEQETSPPPAPARRSQSSWSNAQAVRLNAPSASYGNTGGFINPVHTVSRRQRMKWTDEADWPLLLIGLGREITRADFKNIASLYSEGPTEKAIMERLAKLRSMQINLLNEYGMTGPEADIPRDESTRAEAVQPAKPKKGKKVAEGKRRWTEMDDDEDDDEEPPVVIKRKSKQAQPPWKRVKRSTRQEAPLPPSSTPPPPPPPPSQPPARRPNTAFASSLSSPPAPRHQTSLITPQVHMEGRARHSLDSIPGGRADFQAWRYANRPGASTLARPVGGSQSTSLRGLTGLEHRGMGSETTRSAPVQESQPAEHESPSEESQDDFEWITGKDGKQYRVYRDE